MPIPWLVYLDHDGHARLKYFLRIAEEGSITRAAGVLGIAQPALSRQLQLLEEDLGVALFRRTRRGVELTEPGERLRASTAGPLRQLELAVQYAGSPLARIERGLLFGNGADRCRRAGRAAVGQPRDGIPECPLPRRRRRNRRPYSSHAQRRRRPDGDQSGTR